MINESTQSPEVSIILPTYNGASKGLRKSIDSCLIQSFKNFELIIVDDCSSDQTPELIQSYADPRIKYIRNERNSRLPKSLNIGFKASRGRYLTWTSDDNFYLPEAIEKLLALLKAEQADFVYADYFAFHNGNISTSERINLLEPDELIRLNCVMGCFLYSRKVYEGVGNYNEDMELIEDYDYWVRVSRKFKLRHLNEPLYYYQYHQQSLSGQRQREIDSIFYLFRCKHRLASVNQLLWEIKHSLMRKRGSHPMWDIYYKFFLKKKIKMVLKKYQNKKISFGDARDQLLGIFDGQLRMKSAHQIPHLLFLRKFPPHEDWGGTEVLMFDWFSKIDFSCCRVTLGVPQGSKSIFLKKMEGMKWPINVVEFPSSRKKDAWNRFRIMLNFIKTLKPGKIIFVQGWYADFTAADILAGFLLTRGRVFMHENVGPEESPGRSSKTYFGVIPGLALWWHKRRFFVNIKAYFCKSVLVVSNDIKLKLAEWWGYPEFRMKVTYHGTRTSFYSPSKETRERMRSELNLNSLTLVIIATARLTKLKCLDRLINAFDRIWQQYPEAVLLLAGTGPNEQELKELAKNKKAQQNIRFLGHISSVADYLKMSDIYVLSSDNEGLSLALMEAMSSGLICISTTCPGSPEAIMDGVNGFLVEKSWEGVYSGLKKACALSPQERREMGQRARATVEEKFDVAKNTKKIFSIFGIPFKGQMYA